MQDSQTITRKSGSNLALAFVLLPREKRDGMSALYAFCREVDDVADEESVPVEKRRIALAQWREDIRLACQQKAPSQIVNRELMPFIAQCGMKFEHFDDLIRGVEMDLDIQRYETFETLELYCYRVASVVGLLSIRIFAHQNPRCVNYAIYLGKALQLTNILRDVHNDAERGRIYLPLALLREQGVTELEVLQGQYSERYFAVAAKVAERARHFYRLARENLPPEDRHNMIAAELMGAVYWQLLLKLEANHFNVFGEHPVRLTKGQKLWLIFRTWLKFVAGATSPNYGTS